MERQRKMADGFPGPCAGRVERPCSRRGAHASPARCPPRARRKRAEQLGHARQLQEWEDDCAGRARVVTSSKYSLFRFTSKEHG